MPASDWERLEELFGEALEVPADERPRWLESLVGDDAELRDELVSLLSALPRADIEIDRLRARIVGSEDDARSVASAPSLAYDQPDGWLGRRIGQYRIVEHIGGGGMGVVYRAHDELLDRPVALKFIAPPFGWGDDAKERLLREARAAGAIDHPNICTIHEIREDETGHLFIVMPAYEGESLQDRIARGPLDEDAATTVALGLARALAVAHERGIVHGDVKPGNIFLTADGGMKLLDFGLARVRAGQPTSHAAGGTAPYMSPEQVAGRPADARSDVWMAGATIAAMIGREVRADGSRAPREPLGLLAVARRATAVEPDRRPSDGAALHTELQSLRSSPPRPRAGRMRGWLGRVPRGRGALVGLGIAFVVAAALRGVVGYGPDPVVRHVLWVDDNPENNADVVERLERMGVTVSVAHSTEEALERWIPEMRLVMSDMGRYEGPDGSYVERAGFDLLDTLLARDPSVRVAFCTSFRAATAFGEQARSRGALAVLTDCGQVVELVRRARGAPDLPS